MWSGPADRRVDYDDVLPIRPVSRRWLVSPFEELDGMTRHDGRNRMPVDELGMSIPSQQHEKLSNQVTTPCNLTPFTRKMVSGILLSNVI